MPALAPPPETLDRDLAATLDAATRRIRNADVVGGVLTVAAAGLAYVLAVVVLDKAFDLPAWARQLGFVLALGGMGTLAYFAVAVPLRRLVNPLYAAKRVEDTLDDAKNGIVNWADLRDAQMPESVRKAVGQRAAKQLKDADLGEAVDGKPLLRRLVACGVLIGVLAALFLIFRPTQFLSLFNRAVNPFTAGAIAGRTEITVVTPAGGDVTVTAGQAVYIAVTVAGRVPPADSPEPMRVQLRHAADGIEFDDVPLERGESSREWQVRIPDHLVQNGFWYRVVGGDGTTPEYRVQVRSRPLFGSFEARYEYPAYLRLQPETTTEPQLEGYRGTAVTLTAKTNRELKSGNLYVAGAAAPIPGEVVGETRDALRFKLTLAESGSYRLQFAATTGEENADSPFYAIKVIADLPPTVTIAAPAEPAVTVPANGRFALDAAVGDDFGVAGVVLKGKTAAGRVLKPKPYLGGQSFKREADGSFPTTVEYKDSLALAELTDEAGTPVPAVEGATFEFWLEATDNCGVPGPQVGKSRVVTVKVGPPTPPQPDQRADQEKQAQQKQADKLKNEDRTPPPQPRPEKAEPKPGEQKGDPEQKSDPDQKGTGEQKADPNQRGTGEPKPDPTQKPDPNQKGTGEPKPDPNQKGNGEQKPDPAQKPDPDQKPDPNQKGTGEPKPDPNQKGTGGSNEPQPRTDKGDPNQGAKDEAKRVQQELDNQQRGGKPDPKDVAKAMQDLASNDPQRQQDGRDKLDQTVGPENRKKTEELMNDLKSDDPKRREAAEQKVKEMQKQAAGPDGGAPKPEDLKQAGEQIQKGTPEHKKDGQDKLSKGMEQAAKDQANQLANDLQSKDEGTRKAAEQKLDDLKKQAGGGQPSEQQKKDLEQAAKDLQTGTPEQKQAARDKLDQMMGKDARTQAEQMGKDLQSKDENTRKAAEDKLKEMQKQAGGQQGNDAEKDDLAKAGEDIKNGTPEQKKHGQDKLSKGMEQAAKEQADKLAKDLQSKDEGTRKAAEQKLDELKKQAGGGQPGEQQKKEIEQAAKDLQNGTPEQKQAARDKLDQMMGKDAREKAEQMGKDLQSKDEKTRKAAENKLNEMAKQAGGEPEPKPLTAAEKKDLADAAKKAASKDPAEQKAAQDKLAQNPAVKDLAEGMAKKAEEAAKKDGKTPEQQAKDMMDLAKDAADAAKAMEDLKGDDPQQNERGAEKLKELADKLKKQTGGNRRQDGGRGPAGSETTPDGKPDPVKDFGKLPGELQLETFEKNRGNKDLLKKLGYTDAEYERFLDGFRKAVASEKAAKMPPPGPASPKPGEAATTRRVDEAAKVEYRKDGTAAAGPGSTSGTAPPGYGDARKKFAEAAGKLKENR